jgi:hypothetical protein
MRSPIAQIPPQVVVALGTMTVALAVLGRLWLDQMGAPIHPTQAIELTLLSLFLVAGLMLSYPFPLHIRLKTKIGIGSVPLYLMAALLPPPLAAVAAGIGVFGGHLLVKQQRGTYLSDIVTESARWVLVIAAGALAGHLPLFTGESSFAPFIVVGGVLWLGDVCTLPLALVPITGERPDRIILSTMRQAGLAEATQYIVGMLGALVMQQHIWGLALLTLPTVLVYFAFQNAQQVGEKTRHMLESMADTVDMRDPFSSGHSRRVAELCAGILHELDLHGVDAELIIAAARVHDIGKIGVPDDLMKKPGPLTPEERALMQTHPESGADLLTRYPDFARGVSMVRHHHERWDGEGYPHHLRETAIPLGARVIAVADSFDAMISNRAYRRGITIDRAVAILREGRGRQWDASVVDALVRILADRLEPSAAPPLLRLVPAVADEIATGSETA